jgi:hypothetical protein
MTSPRPGMTAAPTMSMWPTTTTTTQTTRTRSMTGSREARAAPPGMKAAECDALDSLTAPPTWLWLVYSQCGTITRRWRRRERGRNDSAARGATRVEAGTNSQAAQCWRP